VKATTGIAPTPLPFAFPHRIVQLANAVIKKRSVVLPSHSVTEVEPTEADTAFLQLLSVRK